MTVPRYLLSVLRSVRRIALALISIPVVLFLLCIPVWLYGLYLQRGIEERIPAPGRMVDIGTHRLHLDCAGDGPPTIVLNAGGGTWSASWNAVRELLSDDIRVCTYDRAGMGWSDRGPNPRNAEVISDELARLLEGAGEPPPYVMVGVSFGGTIALAFVEKNLDQVAGLVAVETPTYDFMQWRLDTRFILSGRLRTFATPVLAVVVTAFSVVVPIDGSYFGVDTEYDRRAFDDAGFRSRIMSMVIRELPWGEGSKLSQNFGTLPVVVIEGANSEFGSPEWTAAQQQLLSLSTNSKHFLVQSAGHGVPQQAPEAIVEGIDWILANTN